VSVCNFCISRGMVLYAPTRHLGANKEYASKHIYFIIKNHTLLSTTKCRVGAVPLDST
jgi:hypothetical protein